MSTRATSIPTLEAGDGTRVPQLGFGVFQIPPADTAEAVAFALEAGYRSIDTAAAYRNEAEVAEAIHTADLSRDDVFTTTKLWNSDQGRERARRALKSSLERLEMHHVDLYLIHWPAPSRNLYVETWQTLIELREEGLTRAIGVSNFQPEHLQRIIDETGVTPAVNQVELHPRFQQQGLRRDHAELGVLTEAWSPLAQGAVLKDPVITGIAERHQRTSAQVVLRWHIQIGNVVIPKSVTPERIRENVALFDFELSGEDMQASHELDAGERTGPDPDTFSLA